MAKYVCFCGNPTDNETIIGSVVLHTCDACKDRIHREVAWQSEGEQWAEDRVVCPYCGHEYSAYDSWDFDPGGEGEIECELCGKKFDLEVREIRQFSTKRSLCEMPAGWNGEEVQ